MSAVDLSAMMTEDDFLEHAGVKGMKWGKRKAPSPAKEARMQAKNDNDKAIDKARTNIASGKNRRDYLAAKARYKADKAKAKLAFDKVKDKNVADYYKANEYKQGSEKVVGAVSAVASIALAAVVGGALAVMATS